MADITPQQDGSAQITITQGETSGLKALAAQHLPALKKLAAWFEADVAPELKEAADFLESLAANPPEGSTLTVTASQAEYLRGLVTSHLPELQSVLAVVESAPVRGIFTLAKALL